MPRREVRIENWAVLRSSQFPCFEELQPGGHLMGFVIGHPKLPDQSLIYTSRIVKVDSRNGVVETANTLYRLGDPDATYRAWQLEPAHPAFEDQQGQKKAA